MQTVGTTVRGNIILGMHCFLYNADGYGQKPPGCLMPLGHLFNLISKYLFGRLVLYRKTYFSAIWAVF